MNTEKTWQIKSSSSEDTSAIAEKLGSAAKGGEVFLLVSDLGGGKTTFVQGLAKGLGCPEHVGSPTFTINRVYQCRDNLELQHFDFYRLNAAGVVEHELSEAIQNPKAVIAIEWGDIVTDALPKNRIEVKMERVKDDENQRQISISVPSDFSYLMDKLS